MAPKKQQTSSINPNNQPDLLTTFICYNWTIRSQQKKFKTLNKQPNLQCQQLTNCQLNKIIRNNKTSRYLLQRQKDKLLKSNGIQSKSLIRRLINLNKSNLISDQLQNLEEGKICPSPIRKQKKYVDTVKNMDIRQANAIDSRENNNMKQQKEFKIYQTPNGRLYFKKDFNLIQKLQRLHMHRDNLRDDKQDLISKQQQEDKLSDLQEFTIRKNQMTSKSSDKKKLLQTLIL